MLGFDEFLLDQSAKRNQSEITFVYVWNLVKATNFLLIITPRAACTAYQKILLQFELRARKSP